MAKKSGTIVYKCSSCGYSQPRWLGRCPQCGEWNTLEECILDANAVSPSRSGVSERAKPVPLSHVEAKAGMRLATGIAEFDRVLGGGAAMRSAVLIGGEPGIGKRCFCRRLLSRRKRTVMRCACFTCRAKNPPRR